MPDKRQRGGGEAGGIVASVMAVIKTPSHGTVPRHLLLQATGREGGEKKSWRLRHDLPFQRRPAAPCTPSSPAESAPLSLTQTVRDTWTIGSLQSCWAPFISPSCPPFFFLELYHVPSFKNWGDLPVTSVQGLGMHPFQTSLGPNRGVRTFQGVRDLDPCYRLMNRVLPKRGGFLPRRIQKPQSATSAPRLQAVAPHPYFMHNSCSLSRMAHLSWMDDRTLRKAFIASS